MSLFFPTPRVLFWALLPGLIAAPFLRGSWADKSSGLPLLEYIPSKDMGAGETKWVTLEDKFGRLFVGGDGLQVFDGQSWRTFPMNGAYTLSGLTLGSDGRLWAAANNEAGYFEEESLGVFRYHSLIAQLPVEDRLVGVAWGCVQVGRTVYFIYRDKVLRWDGTSLQLQAFPGESRLFPIRMGDEHWLHHLETGLYRLTEVNPRLEVPAAMLPKTGILGLARDNTGLLVASGFGLFRPDNPPRQASDEALSRHITENRLTSFVSLQQDNYALGTVTGGIALSSQAGALLRILSTGDGLPSRYSFSFRTDRAGYLWAATRGGIFNFESTGSVSLFNSVNGLKGAVNKVVQLPDGRLLALTTEGTFQLEEIPGSGSHFQQLTQLTSTYLHPLPVAGGLLLLRHGGIDAFDGSAVRTILDLTGSTVYLALPVKSAPGTFHVLESGGLHRLKQHADGSFEHTFLVKPPGIGITMHEDSAGRLWIGTVSQGVFIYDPATGQLAAANDPAGGKSVPGLVSVVGRSEDLLVLGNGCVLQAQPDGTGLKTLSGAPGINPLMARPLAGRQELIVAFKRATPTTNATEGLGIMTVTKSGQILWRELDVPALGSIGSVNTMEFTRENGRTILWIGGGAGILRLDYDSIPAVQPPATPFIQLDLAHAGQVADDSGFSFSFRDHRLNFHVFTGDYSRSKHWLLQTRLGEAEWSAPVARRSFEFSNLSEGDYRFEVRTINAAGLTSEPSVFTFRILPPWYRSGWAYAGYAAALALGVFGLIRIRERQILARNQELESLVEVRTAALVKASAAKDEFLAGISHEIRNPMNGVIGIADNFRTEGLDPENRRKFNLLRQCASHLSSLLEDILDFSKVQAGAIELDPKPFDLPELVEAVGAITRPDSEKYGIPVELAVSPAVPRALVGDARRIRQILINFVSNALKFSGRGQVSVTVWCKDQGPGRTEVIFAVSDEGPGISAEEQARLFTRFERGAAAQKGRVPGTGLGLALCKGLAEKMGGRIWLESELGQGSCFYFSAPFALAAAPATAAPEAGAVPALASRTALVVDDQEYNRIVLVDLLQAMGFTVHSAQEGSAALQLAGQQAFDVVFLDFNLPGLSGVDIARGIRALPNPTAHALILATTAFTTPEKRAQCLDAGMDAFLGKPVTKERLGKALASFVPVAAPAGRPAPAKPAAIATAAGPADRLVNLRLLARKKGVPVTEELAMYLAELEEELARLNAAIAQQDAVAAGQYAHLLCGRCGFVFERELEQTQREIEAVVGPGQWAEARRLSGEFAIQLADLRVRLASAAQAAPPASGR